VANPRTLAKIAARIKERAAHCIEFEVNDPRSSFVTITRVEPAKDLSVARIFYSVLGNESDKRRTAHMLESASGFIQRKVGRVLQLRRVPRLIWVYDDSIEHAAELDRKIQDAMTRDRMIHEQGHAEGDPAKKDEWQEEYDDFCEEEEEEET
jgi:ribosome-binding factor A